MLFFASSTVCRYIVVYAYIRCIRCDTLQNKYSKLLNKVVIFVFFAHKESWSCKDPCCLWRVWEFSDFIKNTLIGVLKGSWRSYGFGKTWGWVINDRIYIFGWTSPFKCDKVRCENSEICVEGLMWKNTMYTVLFIKVIRPVKPWFTVNLQQIRGVVMTRSRVSKTT